MPLRPSCPPSHALLITASLPFYPPCSQLIRSILLLTSDQIRYSTSSSSSPARTINNLPQSRLNPAPDDFAAPNFADKAELALYAGRGGNGCVSFQREAFLPDGPPNGGDGGHGGNIYIQAIPGETSLHKLARRRFIRAGRGRHGQGSARSGVRGEDVVISVPVGTIVRELERHDPAAEAATSIRAWLARKKEERRQQQQSLDLQPDNPDDNNHDDDSRRRPTTATTHDDDHDPDADDPQRAKWLLYPGMSKSEVKSAQFPRLPRRTQLFQQPPSPIYLDLSRPTPTPILLAAGGIGGLGNPHFTSRQHPRPLFATRGDDALTLKISLELKLLADVGLVGLPNAGKSTLLRALSNSRARVGSWAFTTLQPNIGTVVLDKYSGRPDVYAQQRSPPKQHPQQHPRTRFTVADIPGLIEGAHLDRGLGIAFLRHVERAAVLAFVVDLAAGDAVHALQALWREVALYAQMRDDQERARQLDARIDWDPTPDPLRSTVSLMDDHPDQTDESLPHITAKPWFVVASKADLPHTQDNFAALRTYVDEISRGSQMHPCGLEGAWTRSCAAIPVSAINGQGVDRVVHWTVGLLDQ